MPSETVIALRKQLREKFPAAHRQDGPGTAPPTPAPATGSLRFPLSTAHYPAGAITEISPAHPACGLSLVIAALLAEEDDPLRTAAPPLVLIDARDHFDPASFTPGECSRLLWLRCRETGQALRAADLLLRDGNLPFVLLDLSALPPRELRRIPGSSWHRLRQLAESTSSTLLALTPVPLITRAALRLILTRELTLTELDQPRPDLLQNLQTQSPQPSTRTA